MKPVKQLFVPIIFFILSGKSLKYATNSSGSFATSTVHTEYTLKDVGVGSSIKVDSSGKVYISYYDATYPEGALKFAVSN
ncbi:hypothetical protein HZC34_02965 [Candidatus Saganbacteria bacterium]|nr:hypothetical protein [Candidatus Saganbacteria bacterium]